MNNESYEDLMLNLHKFIQERSKWLDYFQFQINSFVKIRMELNPARNICISYSTN